MLSRTKRRLFLMFLAALLLAGAGCDSDPPPAGGDVTGGDGIVDDGGSGDGTRSDGTAGDGTAGDGTAGDGTAGDGTPGDGTPGDGTPGDGTPGDGTPGDGTPGDGTPADAPADGSPADGATADTTVDQGVAADTTVDQGVAADTTVDQGVAADTSVDQGVSPDTSVDQGVSPDATVDSGSPAATAFRINSLALADPHAYLTGCTIDLTGTLNNLINTSVTTDGDNDGLLDLSYLLVFRPLNQGSGGGTLEVAEGNCATTTACTRTLSSQPALASAPYANQSSGTCLGRQVGGVDVTDHAPTETTAPCFVSQRRNLAITISGITVQLRDAQVAARYNTTPATSLDRGLLRGFITQADAQNTLLPASLPFVGGRTLASLLCAAGGNSEADTHPTFGAGWWFFLEYSAAQVTYTES